MKRNRHKKSHGGEITARLNKVYDKEESCVSPDVTRAQAEAIPGAIRKMRKPSGSLRLRGLSVNELRDWGRR